MASFEEKKLIYQSEYTQTRKLVLFSNPVLQLSADVFSQAQKLSFLF